jgi:5-formyltetrahydrofolate cyclo-ligase
MSPDLAEQKRQLRESVAPLRRAVSARAAARAAASIADRLLAEPALRRAARVALYAALPDEVPTRPLFDALAALGAARLFPRVTRAEVLEFAPVADWGELRLGRYGVPEPPPQAAAVELAEGDLVLVPGVAFDRAGNRLGRGRGCYDRTFPAGASGSPLLVGIAYELQLVARVPHGPGDRRMHAVVTERGLHWAPAAVP